MKKHKIFIDTNLHKGNNFVMTSSTSRSLQLVVGGGLAAGLLASTSAKAQIVTSYPDATVGANDNPDSFPFDVGSDGSVTINTTSQNPDFNLTSFSGLTDSGKVFAQNGDVSIGTITEGSTVGPTTVLTPGVSGDHTATFVGLPNNGDNYVGFSISSGAGVTNYGYLVIDQSNVGGPNGSADPDTVTLAEVGYNETAGGEITAPEPAAGSLLALGALGLGGLALLRHRRAVAA
jgi:MYXO-CTERM domain-containing protein